MGWLNFADWVPGTGIRDSNREDMKELFLSWGLLILSVIFNAGGVFIVKWNLNHMGAIQTTSLKTIFQAMVLLLKSPGVISGVILFFIAPVLFIIALSRMDIAVAYPVQVGLNFLILLLLAVFFLGEQITPFRWIGLGFIFCGIYFLNR